LARFAITRLLNRAEIPAETVQLAHLLIGNLRVRDLSEGVSAGRIVETEGYDIGDRAGA
jgi:3-methyladenine DNA glycosylase Mpg